ncbi:hypothetical protein G3I77_36810 [Streptomyces sp. D2-8]|uniref:hypothetical protein n=1 Tax=Streptomyces sp. D2-8 TaxID=2707767 RepID=UPI0027E4C5D8|nr:hypothetical protein [Streptomyces sp. D2-8]MCK8438367.1 hypothetical protein [Streptomyces sp. D2-8]
MARHEDQPSVAAQAVRRGDDQIPVRGVHHGRLDAEAQLDKYRKVLDRLMALSLLELESRALIHHIVQSL